MKTDVRPTDLDGETVDIDGRSAPPTNTRRRDGRIPLPSRALMLKLHRWLSLGGLVWILIITLTGAVLVFAPQITAWSRPELFKATAGDKGPQAMVDTAIAHFEGQDAGVDTISFPADNRGVYVLQMNVTQRATAEQLATGAKIDRKPRSWMVYLDPGTGNINGARPEASGFIYWSKRGHYVLWQDKGFLGVDGDDFAGLVALTMLAITLLGFYIWYFPKTKHWFRNLRIRSKRGFFLFNLDLHRTLGLAVLLPLTVISFTGAGFSFPDMKLAWERLTPAKHDYIQHEPEETPVSEEPGEDEEPVPALTTDGVWQMLKERYPKDRLNSIEPPIETTGVWGAYLTRGYDPRQRDNTSGNVYIAIDRFSHEVIYEGTPEQGNVWDQAYEDWSLPLHAGDFLGNASRWVWLLVGLSPTVLSISGVIVWWKRRQRRQSKAAVEGEIRRRNSNGATAGTGELVIDLTNHGQRPAPAEHVDRLTALFVTRAPKLARVRVRGPIRLDAAYQPEPDIALVRARPYGDGHPGAADTLLVVEVADPGDDDRDVKLLVYALAGVPEVWIVDPDDRTVTVHRGPRAAGWARIARHGRGDTLEPVALKGTSFAVADLLGESASSAVQLDLGVDGRDHDADGTGLSVPPVVDGPSAVR